ncbi:MAG: 50S ribosomal protein L28 [Candidatus Riesia sp.]|nr:50S ribosomal protein L28 [Candidatus Riesia sp.]
MSKFCFVTNKKVMFGNNVSHSNRKTRRRFLPNIHKLKIWIPEKKSFVRLNVSAKGLRIINKLGISKVLKNGKKKNKKY